MRIIIRFLLIVMVSMFFNGCISKEKVHDTVL